MARTTKAAATGTPDQDDPRPGTAERTGAAANQDKASPKAAADQDGTTAKAAKQDASTPKATDRDGPTSETDHDGPTSETADQAGPARETTDRDGTAAKTAEHDGVAAAAEQAEPSPEAEADAPKRKRRAWFDDPVLAVAIALAVIAAVAAGYFGWSWYAAAHDGSLSFSAERDAVLRTGEQGVQNLNTLDYRNADQGFSLWEDSSTGDLHNQLVQGRDQFITQVRQARTITSAKILDGAVVELDTRAGKASLIAAVQVTVTPSGGTPATKQSRMQAQLTRTPSGWKLSGLGEAPVGTGG